MSSPDRIAAASFPVPPQHHGLALASRGDALTPYLFEALRRKFADVGFINPELTALQRYRVAALTVRPSRDRWVERFYKSAYAGRLRSDNAARSIRSLPKQPGLVFQVHALFAQSASPTVLYLDCTHAQSAQLWPAWNPLRGSALSAWYERERETYRMARHIFAFCEPTKASLVDDYGIDTENITVTGAGANFASLPELPDTPAREEHPTILFIGNDFERKGGMVLLDAFRQVRETIPGARLQLVGVAPGVTRQPGVEILGRINDRARISSLYADASVFVVPSFFDPYPLVALEAMAFGLPVITTRQMGTPEMISDGTTGLLVAPGDSRALADSLVRVLRDPAEAARLGRAARRDVESRFTWDAVVDRMAPALERLLAEATE